jgi:hypothetical protein
LSTTVGVPINGQVATFASTDVSGNSPQAAIAWGDGHTSTGTVVMNSSGFAVVGANTYMDPGTYNVIVTVTGTEDSTASGLGQVMVAPALSGHLDPLSDTGASNTDGITAINQPTFIGTATPYAIVSLFARRADQAQPVLLDQGIASALGNWHISQGALPNGAYSFNVAQTPPTGPPSTMTALTPESVVIDTVAPTALAATTVRGRAQIRVVLKDNLSGIDQTTAANPANYALVLPHGVRVGAMRATILAYPTIQASDPITVVLQFNSLPGIQKGLTIAFGGITDLAGNPLSREFIKVTLVPPKLPGARRALRLNQHARF